MAFSGFSTSRPLANLPVLGFMGVIHIFFFCKTPYEKVLEQLAPHTNSEYKEALEDFVETTVMDVHMISGGVLFATFFWFLSH
jgi:hypothetical protein